MQAATPIQGPAPETLAALLKTIDSGALTDGPALAWCPVNQVFLCVTVNAGIIAHWSLEPCPDHAAAVTLMQKYRQLAMQAARAAFDSLPEEARAALASQVAAQRTSDTRH